MKVRFPQARPDIIGDDVPRACPDPVRAMDAPWGPRLGGRRGEAEPRGGAPHAARGSHWTVAMGGGAPHPNNDSLSPMLTGLVPGPWGGVGPHSLLGEGGNKSSFRLFSSSS
ncbi:hypothetical protein NL676_039618 [Syzygium grande]|nr:hypothetical protein NL676_039618 [Syzygium grande]